MSADSPQPTAHQDSGGCSRRGYLKRIGVAGGTIATLGAAGEQVASPVGRAEAVDWEVVKGTTAATAAAGPIGLGWALREYEVIGSDAPPEGLTADALKESSYQTARTRKSTNASTFVDNRNIIEGAKNAAYANAKVSAIEALNNQETQDSVTSAGTSEVDERETIIKRNLAKSWNESINELETTLSTIESHSDTSVPDHLYGTYDQVNQDDANYAVDTYESWEIKTETITLPNGDEFDLKRLHVKWSSSGSSASATISWDPTQDLTETSETQAGSMKIDSQVELTFPSGDVTYLSFKDWNGLWSDIESQYSSVRDGITTWVDGVYGDVQAGELDTAELMTPQEMAQVSANSGVNQAMADLMALNIPIDLEREATISIERENETLSLVGSLAITTEPSNPIEAGSTYDSANLEGDVYFTYDVAAGAGSWMNYETGIDGGVVTFTREPYEDLVYQINTTAGESGEAVYGSFTEDTDGSGNTIWTVDLSDQLETAITEVESVDMYSESDETQYETVQIEDSFTVEKIEDSEGNEVDSMEFSQSEPQDDTNYVSEEEWKQMEQRNEELIQKYEDAQGGGLGWFDGTSLEGYGGPIAGAAVVILGILGIGQLSN